MLISIIILALFIFYLGKRMIDEMFENKNSQVKVGKVGLDKQIYFDDDTWIDLDPSMRNTPAFDVKPGDRVKMIVKKMRDYCIEKRSSFLRSVSQHNRTRMRKWKEKINYGDMKTIQISDEDYEFLKDLQHELNTQTNDGNADPVY